MNKIQSFLTQTNYSNNDSQFIKKTSRFLFIFFLTIIIILLLSCYFINGLTDEIKQLTREIQHYLYHVSA